ncbi:hypothetical protein BDB00DRAFT_750852, partial [Zychaea mexicana]|uniref:uncharacterized protein n=1 Tax=Zychaea mexicana TaxID=64656 RepID=UPI0022FE0EC6
SHNQIRTLPNELGNLTHLRVLNLSYNRIVALPNSIHRLNRLRAVNVSHNQLHTLPASMCTLDDLCVLIVNNNSLVHLPYQLGRLKRLATFHIGDNPLLTSLPAEIADMPSIRKLMADHCGFPETVPLRLPHDPPSLVETCARQLIKLRYSNATGSSKIAPYLATAKTCSVCKGPYFDACVRHHRMVDRSGTSIAIEYRLCSLHWTTEEDRLLYTFGCRQVMP